MDPIKEALTFDDVTLAPNYSEILPSEVKTEVKLSKHLNISIPLIRGIEIFKCFDNLTSVFTSEGKISE